MRHLIVLLLLLACAGGGFCADRPVALLTNLAGTVRIDGKPARLLQGVSTGARIECPAYSSVVTLSYITGGVRVRVRGPQTYVVVASPTAINRDVEISKPSASGSMALPDQVNIDRIGGGRPADTLLLMVGRTMDPNALLEWRTTNIYAEYSVAVDGPGLQPWRETRPMRGAVTRAGEDGKNWVTYRYALPPDVAAAMKPGVEYEFRLTASERSGARGQTWTARFHIVDPAAVQSLAALQERVAYQAVHSPSDITPAMELAQRYLGNDMLFAALHVVEAADEANPYVQELRRRLLSEAIAVQEVQNSRGSPP